MENMKRARRSGRALIASLFAAVALVLGPVVGSQVTAEGKPVTPRPTIVLVHGNWADASSWTSVIERLQRRGFTVVAPPNLLRGPVTDSAYLASYLETISGPMVLVGHSYGGFPITDAATGNADVKALVYIDAFIPDQGEIPFELAASSGSCVDLNGLNQVPFDGGLDFYLRWEAHLSYPGFTECFANGVGPKDAAVLAATQRPAGAGQVVEAAGPPAWKTIPSWALIGTLDRVIPPALQEMMSSRAGAQVSRVRTGHLSLITRPNNVTDVIEAAVEATT
jgi:pimeloyl-ACP methyl ester carboxylesterase